VYMVFVALDFFSINESQLRKIVARKRANWWEASKEADLHHEGKSCCKSTHSMCKGKWISWVPHSQCSSICPQFHLC